MAYCSFNIEAIQHSFIDRSPLHYNLKNIFFSCCNAISTFISALSPFPSTAQYYAAFSGNYCMILSILERSRWAIFSNLRTLKYYSNISTTCPLKQTHLTQCPPIILIQHTGGFIEVLLFLVYDNDDKKIYIKNFKFPFHSLAELGITLKGWRRIIKFWKKCYYFCLSKQILMLQFCRLGEAAEA